jgi:nucleoside-diphosphate-sugar epimerase
VSVVIFGYGYTAEVFARRVRARFDRIVATTRSPDKAAQVAEAGFIGRVFPEPDSETLLEADLARAQACLVSVPPALSGDPVLARFSERIAAAPGLRWIGYLSTIGVYGDHQGAWVDESTPPHPVSERSRERLAAEEAWLALGRRSRKAVQIFRLAGIYGPGRSPLDRLLDRTATRIVKPGQVFNRIHVEDIAAVLVASLDRPRPGAIYNVADEVPAPPQDVISYAAELAGIPPPPEVPFEAADLTPMGRSFYAENKRTAARLIHEELGVTLTYPTYREGLAALAADLKLRSGSRLARNS